MERIFYVIHTRLEPEQKYLIRTYFIIGETLVITNTPPLVLDDLVISWRGFDTNAQAEIYKEEYENICRFKVGRDYDVAMLEKTRVKYPELFFS